MYIFMTLHLSIMAQVFFNNVQLKIIYIEMAGLLLLGILYR